MNITVDISMYPLDADYKPAIKSFIRHLREFEGLEIVTNQLSTQIIGDFATVTAALNACMAEAMAGTTRVVFVARYLNTELDIRRLPDID
jgi:uncharacterized protein YqgV (UPF0045/DUF77 family)